MPALSMFYGIIVRMYSEPNSKHKEPHIHIQYQTHEAVYTFDGTLIDGKLPLKQHKMVVCWIALHEDELFANWILLCDGQKFYKIPPLQ